MENREALACQDDGPRRPICSHRDSRKVAVGRSLPQPIVEKSVESQRFEQPPECRTCLPPSEKQVAYRRQRVGFAESLLDVSVEGKRGFVGLLGVSQAIGADVEVAQ